MSHIEIRPRFQRESFLEKEEVLSRLRRALDRRDQPVRGLIVDHHVTLKIPAEEQHFWSPQLSLEVEAREGGSLIRGLYGPRPSVWLMFVFFYAFLGFVIMVVAVIGFSEWSLGLPGRILWLLPVAGFIMLMVYLTARAGQKLGREEMIRLRDFINQVLETEDK
jgi:hypothetical protein